MSAPVGPVTPLSPELLRWLLAGLWLAALSLIGWRRRRARGASGKKVNWGAVVFDCAFLFFAFDNIPRLLTGSPWSPSLLLGLLAWRLSCAVALGLYVSPALPFRRTAVCWLLAEAAFGLGAWWLCLHFPVGLTSRQTEVALLIRCAWLLLAAGWARGIRSRLSPVHEICLGLLLLAALILGHPWFSPFMVGTGDAKLYQETLQDFRLQLQAGVHFPWISQSEVAPFGAVFPFRFATYHFYLGAALQGLTAGGLSLYAVQHLTVVLSLWLGGWSMYWALQRLYPRRPAINCALAFCYLAAPAWLGPLYSFTMFFTVMALPFMPLALAGAWPSVGAASPRAAVWHGAALAAVWHAHVPVGFWVSAMVLATQGIGWIALRPGWKIAGRQLLAWTICVLLCCGLFYSVATLSPRTKHAIEEATTIVSILQQAFPASLLPAQAGQGLGAIQPGYSLLLGLALAIAAFFAGRRTLIVWALPAFLLILLIFPFPGITLFLWKLLPVAAKIVAGPWSIQRLAPPFAGLATLAAAGALDFWIDRLPHRRVGFIVGLGVAVAWSAAEAVKYVRRGHETVLPAALSNNINRPENTFLLVNWFAFQPFPPSSAYEVGKYHDPFLLNRVWSQDQSRTLVDNRASLLVPNPTSPPVPVTANPLVPGIWRLLPYFMFETGQRYLLELTPGPLTPPGTFTMAALDFQHSETFPGGASAPVIFPFWSSASNAQPMEMIFLPTDPAKAGTPIEDFLHYRLIPYRSSALPIEIKTLIPYQARVTLAEAGWLETHRLYVEGYQATVNEKQVAVAISPDNRVMIPLPAGASEVRLDYVGPPLLHAGYLLMAAGWTALTSVGIFLLARWWIRPAPVS